MIDYRNPYTPGAGAMPKYLAGRDDILESASLQLKALAANYQSRSLVLYGLRGVGKTVLLNSIESIAEGERCSCSPHRGRREERSNRSLGFGLLFTVCFA